MMMQKGSFTSILPIFSLFIFAGYRLVPSMQQIYVSFTRLSFITPSVNKLYNELNNLKSINYNENKEVIVLNKSIELKIYNSY